MTQSALMTSAKVAPSVIRTPELFRLSRHVSRKCPLEVTKEIDGVRFKFVSPTQLTVDDLDVLVGLVAIAGRQSDSYKTSKQSSGPDAEIRIMKMMSKNVEVRTTYSALARELGRSPGGGTWPLISAALARLIAVTVYAAPTGRTDWRRFIAGHLFESLAVDEPTNAIALKLSPVLAAAVLGGPGEFIQLNTGDFRKLKDKSGVARLLYLYLHSFYADQSHEVSTDRLIDVIYGTDIDPDLRRKYRARVNAAMTLIDGLDGWSVKSLTQGFRFRHSGPKIRSRQGS